MNTVTDIKQSTRVQTHYFIFIDHKFRFTLTESVLLSHPEVRINANLTDNQVDALVDLATFLKVQSSSYNYLLRRPHSIKEFKSYLFQKKIHLIDDQNKLIAHFLKLGLLDDEKFCEFWISSRSKKPQYSSSRIRSELQSKGISSHLITKKLEYFSNADNLIKLIEKKKSKYNTTQKLLAYLVSKGYSYSESMESFRALGLKNDLTAELDD